MYSNIFMNLNHASLSSTEFLIDSATTKINKTRNKSDHVNDIFGLSLSSLIKPNIKRTTIKISVPHKKAAVYSLKPSGDDGTKTGYQLAKMILI